MKSCIYKKRFLKIQHCWFGTENNIRLEGDITIFHGISEPRNDKRHYAKKQYSLLTDLSEELDTIYGCFNKNYRYEIRRAEKEHIQYETYWGDEILKEKYILEDFSKTYDEMYIAKGLNAKFNQKLINEYIKNKEIVFTIAKYREEALVFHSYIFDAENARFLYSASPFRDNKEMAAVIARMNKGLHWHDMKLFKENGILKYDWGGISDPDNPNGIDKFKMGFGGKIIQYWNEYRANSIIGSLCLRMMLR